MPVGLNVDLGNDLITQGLSAAATDALLVPATDVTQFKSLVLTIKSIAYSGTLLFEWSDYDQTPWNPMNLFELSNTTRILYTTHTSSNGIVYGGPTIFPYFRVRMNPYVSGTAQATLQLSRETLPGVQIATVNTATVLDSTNKLGWTRNDGVANTAIAAGVSSDTVVSAQAGMLASVLVTTTGTNSMLIYDNASAGSGTIIGLIPANPTVNGVPYVFRSWANNGITVKGNGSNPAVTIFYS